MSKVQFQCPTCGCTLTSQSHSASVKCPKCQTLISIKSNEGSPPESKLAGVYQQDDMLVVNLKRYEFDPVCHKTGEATENEYSFLTLDPTSYIGKPGALLFRLLMGRVGLVFYTLMFGKRIQLLIPTQTDVIARFKSGRKRFCLLVFIIAYAVAGGAFALVWSEMGANPPVAFGVFATIALVVSTAFSLFAVFFYWATLLATLRSDVYHVKTSEGNYVWIGGVNPEVIKRYEPSTWAKKKQ